MILMVIGNPFANKMAFEAYKAYINYDDCLKESLALLLPAESFIDRSVTPERAKK